jgi:hypothetical protein
LGEEPEQVSVITEVQPAEKAKVENSTIEMPKPVEKEDGKQQKTTISSSSKAGTKPNETRATFIINEDVLEKLKAIAYWERILIKDVIHEAFKEAITNYEKRNGKIKPLPGRVAPT